MAPNGNLSSNIEHLSITGVPNVIQEERSQATQSVISSYDSRDSISTADDSSEVKNISYGTKMSKLAKDTRRREELDPTSQKSDGSKSCSSSIDEKQLCQQNNKAVNVKHKENTNDIPSTGLSTLLVNEELETKSVMTSITPYSENKSISERNSSCVAPNNSSETVNELRSKSGLSFKEREKEQKPTDDCSLSETSNKKVTSVGPLKNNEKYISVDNDIQAGSKVHQGENFTKIAYEGPPMKITDKKLKTELMVQSTMISSVPTSGGSPPIQQPFIKAPILQNNESQSHQPFITAQIPQNILYQSTSQSEVLNQANHLKFSTQNQANIAISKAQSIPNVAIVPGIKGEVVAKKGRFNVLKDGVISSNHIISGNSISSQQGSLNIVGGMQQLPKATVIEHAAMTTSVIQPHSKDSAQATFPRPGSPRLKNTTLSSCGSIVETQQNGINHITQNVQISNSTTNNSMIKGTGSLLSTSSNPISNSTSTNNAVPPGATKIGRFILSSATSQPPNTAVISTPRLSRNSPNPPDGQSQLGNASIVDPKQPIKPASAPKFIQVSDPRVGVALSHHSDTTNPDGMSQLNQSYQVNQHTPIISEAHHQHNIVAPSQQVGSMRSTTDVSLTSQNKYQRVISTQLQQGVPMVSSASNSPTLTSVGLPNSNSLHTRNPSVLTHSQNPSIVQGQQSSNHLQSSSILHNTVNNHPPTSSVLKGSGLSGAIPGGMGKMLHFLDQMKLEATEADKFIISLQKDLKFLREKNKELEMNWLKAEKQCLEEKKSREIAEAKLKCLKKKMKETKVHQHMVPVVEQEKGNCCDLLGVSTRPEPKLSQSGSTTFSSMTTCSEDELLTEVQNTRINSLKEHEKIGKSTHSSIDSFVQLNGKVGVKEEAVNTKSRNIAEDDNLLSVPVLHDKAKCNPNNLDRKNISEKQSGLNLLLEPNPRESQTTANEFNQIQEIKAENLTRHARSASNILRDFDPFQPSDSQCSDHDNRIQNQSSQKRNILESQSVPMFQIVENGIKYH